MGKLVLRPTHWQMEGRKEEGCRDGLNKDKEKGGESHS